MQALITKQRAAASEVSKKIFNFSIFLWNLWSRILIMNFMFPTVTLNFILNLVYTSFKKMLVLQHHQKIVYICRTPCLLFLQSNFLRKSWNKFIHLQTKRIPIFLCCFRFFFAFKLIKSRLISSKVLS